ncbi:MAG TPA: helix-turn-helix transcriptional regulator [Vicinamibacterales bacterium]|nr:helix-turn-helix transcriptional regulator [Vicinamibacterales bacterium]
MAPDKMPGDFGAKLRQAREGRGLTLRVIADATKISVRALEALERNEIARLPGGIFSRAFVRAYAVEVGLEPEQTITEFITRFPDETVTQGHPRTRALVDELGADPRRRRCPALAWAALAAVVAMGLAVYFGLTDRRAVVPAGTPAVAVPGRALSGSTPLSAPFVVTLHALRATRFSITPDGGSAIDVALDAGVSRAFQASRELLVTPSEPSALEWWTDGNAARGLTGPISLTRQAVQGTTGRP